MNAKLTLKLDSQVIERAKEYAQSYNTSLSKLIEAYLDNLTQRQARDSRPPLTPLVESLYGIASVPPGFNEKEAYFDHLTEKNSPENASSGRIH
jgi:hypothetical protein